MKKNYEELNYRFRKELLNSFGYSLYFSLLYDVETSSIDSGFNYSAWVKGLFKTNGVDDKSLIDAIGCIYEEFEDINPDMWDIEYERGCGFVDLLNIQEFVSSYVKMYYSEWQYSGVLWNIGLSLVNSDHSDGLMNFIHENIELPDEIDESFKKESRKMHEDLMKKWAVKFITEKCK